MIDSQSRARLRSNWMQVRDEVRAAAEQSGRADQDVVILGVSKYVDVETTAALIDAGCRQLAESRPQQLWQKADQLDSPSVAWHLVGHLQRNKIRRTLRIRPLIHSVDSMRVLEAISQEAVSQETEVKVLLEVNISNDAAKTGFDPQDLPAALDRRPSAGVEIVGLMAMAGWGTNPDEARKQFAETRQLRDRLAGACGLALRELSMGMSGDFAEAIAEGATMVRIGSRLFEGVRP